MLGGEGNEGDGRSRARGGCGRAGGAAADTPLLVQALTTLADLASPPAMSPSLDLLPPLHHLFSAYGSSMDLIKLDFHETLA